MKKKLLYIYNYFIYRSKAINEHGVHSPFVFDLLMDVIYNRNDYYCFKAIEKIREQLLDSKKTILLIETDWDKNAKSINKSPSTGNQQAEDENKTIEKKVSQVTKQNILPTKYSQLLFRLVNHFQPSQILEIGTSLGINTGYMAAVSSKIDVITIEENPEIAEIAKQNFKQLKLKNIEQKTGSIDAILPLLLTKYQNLSFVYFDGNHSKQDTLNYFYLCLEKADETSIFVFDSMYLSSETKETWDEIKKDDRVTVTLDLFYLGIVFFRKEQVKQHFVINF